MTFEKMNDSLKITASGKSTGSGAWERTLIISTKQRKIINPMHTHSSRTGNHWTDTWYLLPGLYVVVEFYRTGNGNHHHRVALLRIKNDLTIEESVIGIYENEIVRPLPQDWLWITELDERIELYFVVKAVE